MTSMCWKDVNERLRDQPYLDQLLCGVKHVPKHIAFLYCGKKLLVASANSGNKHAEENVVDKFRQMNIHLCKNKPYKMYVVKLHGSHQMSRPCAECSAKISKFCQRARVYYTDYDGQLREDEQLDNPHRSVRRTGRRDTNKENFNYEKCIECE